MNSSTFDVRAARNPLRALLFCALIGLGSGLTAQTSSPFQSSVPQGEATATPLELSLDGAMERALRLNLGAILTRSQSDAARGQLLSKLQTLLPEVDLTVSEAVAQVDLPAMGMRIKGFPTTLGPFGYSDVRGSMSWALVDVASMRRYLAERHNFRAAQLTAEDARELVVLAIGNAYLTVLADQAQLASTEAQSATAKISLEQAVARHAAGTVPMLDELRARVDAQRLDQQQIVARNTLEKDKLALARAIGLPLDQSFNLTDKVPYAALDKLDLEKAVREARASRRDLAALGERAQAAEELKKAAAADRYPRIAMNGDWGDIGPTLGQSHGTVNAQATLSVPLFKELELRGQEQVTRAQLDTAKARLSDADAQVEADIRFALLDMESARQQLEVAQSSVSLAEEALSQAQQRYAAGVSDNLAVSQAQQSMAAAHALQVTALYRHNLAKLSLARAMGVAQNYKMYLGGK